MTKLSEALRRALRRAADPDKAAPMRAYMKSSMPFLGVPKPARTVVEKEVLREVALPSAAVWRREVLGLYREARFREERYSAIALAQDRRARAFHDMEALPMFEEMIVTGAWWDLVDPLATLSLGLMLRRNPEEMRATMLSWSRDDDLWKRRSAILCQLGFKGETDLELLYAAIEPSIASKEFFLRKAIGWALRQHARTDPSEVARYVAENEGRLSPLSRREAMKHLGAIGA